MDPRLDITDLYAFNGEQGTVLVTNHDHSLARVEGKAGLHPEGRYEFKVDTDGDAVEDLTYRFAFDPTDTDGHQHYRIHKITGADAGDPLAAGTLVGEGTTGTVTAVAGGGRAWVGLAGDPFWIEPTVLHAVGEAFHHGTDIDLGDWTPAQATNLFAGHTVYSIVLELPDDEILGTTTQGSGVGVWALSSLATDAGGWRPINRAGLPMVHPLFTQLDEDLGDELNVNAPSEDRRIHGDRIGAMVAGVIAANHTAIDPGAYATHVVDRLLPNVLPYTPGTPATLGFAGWNGRTLTDNAPDVMFSFAANTPVTLGIGRHSVTAPPTAVFPYVPAAST